MHRFSSPFFLLFLCLATAGCSCGGDDDPVPTDGGMDGATDGSMMRSDSGSPAECGNTLVEEGEDCDDGNDSEDDDCLNDCTFACGDGVVNSVELCDTGIAAGDPGACPTDCDDSVACTVDTLDGSGCTVQCTNGDITTCSGGDGCCPTGCTGLDDSDCTGVCDNGIIEAGETCDPISSCPTDCDDMDACTTDTLMGDASSCTAACANDPVTACTDGDGCCPAGCDSTMDDDCSASCGNGTVEAGEFCDPPSSCPTMCDDMRACTTNRLVGSASNCTARCRFPRITMCIDADGCCPAGCNAVVDDDCMAMCGNSITEPGETCDDGNTTSGDGCDSMCQLETGPTAFRATSLILRDPHAFTRVLFFCSDITGQLNMALSDEITMDGDMDGLLDLSFVLIFRPLNQSVPGSGMVEFVEGDCTAGAMTSCDRTMGAMPVTTTFTNMGTGSTCLSTVMGTVRPYTPAVTTPMGPCFVTASTGVTISLSGVMVQLFDAQIAATYNATPATRLTNGLIRGFLRETDANMIILPMSVPIVGGQPLSSVLRGGMGNCASGSDIDTHPTHGRGWWFYLNFAADQVTWTGP